LFAIVVYQVNVFIECDAVIASKLAPTGDVQDEKLRQQKRPRISEAFYLGFNLVNFPASFLEKVRT